MHRVWTRLLLCGVVLTMVTPWAGVGQGHGPVYGLSTPTLGRGGWSLDVAGMGRFLGADRTMMIRPMLSYGVTEDLQVSASLPIPVVSSSAIPSARAFTRMPASRDVEMMVGWRVQRRSTGVGARQETTVWLAADVPTESSRDGLQTAPSVFGSAVTGYASRSIYAWLGGALEHSLTAGPQEHRAGGITMGSLVIGYRPSVFRRDYPSADWRAFVELVAETVRPDQIGGIDVTDSGDQQLYGALTVLGLYGSWGVAGGPAFPLYQSLNGNQPNEGMRVVLNLTFWF